MVSWLGSATLIVTVSWWVGLLLWATLSGNLPQEFLGPMGLTARFSFFGLICGVAGTLAWVGIDRQERRKALQGTDVRGLTSSIGDVPFLLKPPKEALNLPDLRCPDVEDGFYVRWLAKHQKVNPKHAALARRLLRILAAHKRLPASPTGERHGRRTLLEHSLLCGSLMHEMAQSFEYDGTVLRAGGRIKLGLRDAAYQFDKHDPMCLVIGLAHDFGKIEAYKYDDDGKVFDIGREHDTTGARIVARLEECWDLPDADRFAMTMAIAHYHHPVELPLAPDRRAIDDRTIALMELLVITDTMASAIEHDGKRLNKDELEQRLTSPDALDIQDRAQNFFDFFANELHNQASFNLTSNEGGRNLGWVCDVVGSNRKLLLINEGNMLAAVARRAEVDPRLYAGDGRSLITIEILKRLQARGELITSMKVSGSGDVVQMPAESALWHVHFAKKTPTGFVRHFGPVVCYVLEPNMFLDLVRKMGAATSRAEIAGPVMGMGRAIRNNKAPSNKGAPAPAKTPGTAAVREGPTSAEQTSARDDTPAAPGRPAEPESGSAAADAQKQELASPPAEPAAPTSAPAPFDEDRPAKTEGGGAPAPAPAPAPPSIYYEAERGRDRKRGGSGGAKLDTEQRQQLLAIGAPMKISGRSDRGDGKPGQGPPTRPSPDSHLEPTPDPARENSQHAPSPRDGSLLAPTTGDEFAALLDASAASPGTPTVGLELLELSASGAGLGVGAGAEPGRGTTMPNGANCANAGVGADPGAQGPMVVSPMDEADPQDRGPHRSEPKPLVAMSPEDFELQAYEDRLAAGFMSGGDDGLEEKGEHVGRHDADVSQASTRDERQRSLEDQEPPPGQEGMVENAGLNELLAPAAEPTAEPSSAGKAVLTIQPDYFEKWTMAVVNRMGTEAVSRFEFGLGTAMITLAEEDLVKFAPEVDWGACRYWLMVYQQEGRFRNIKVLPGPVKFQIVVTLSLEQPSTVV